jgi:hypothetical protein
MNLDQLTGRQFRLKRELALAYSELPWNTGRIDRLHDELALTEAQISAAREAAAAKPNVPVVPSAPALDNPPSTHAWLGSFAGRLLQLRPSMSIGSAVRYAVMSIHHAAGLDPRRAAELLVVDGAASTRT